MAGKIIADIIEAPVDRISLNVGNLTVLSANSSGLNFIPTGNVNVNIGGASANLTMNLLTANGIKFPGTQVSSADANTLDDYEEGTWTPSVAGNATYSSRIANYTKVGNLVYIQCALTMSSIGTGSTTTISGLPFASRNTGTVQTVNVGYYLSLASSINWLTGYVENNAATIQFAGNSTAATSIQNNGFAVFGSSTTLIFSACYIAT